MQVQYTGSALVLCPLKTAAGRRVLALAAGVDLKVVADQLGHCSIVLTADTYVSVAVELAVVGGGKIRKPSATPRAVVTAA